jgi:hypothetical protein
MEAGQSVHKNTLPVVIETALVLQMLDAIVRTARGDDKEDAMARRQQTSRLLDHASSSSFKVRPAEQGIKRALANNQVKGLVLKGKSFRKVGTQKLHGTRTQTGGRPKVLVKAVAVVALHQIDDKAGKVDCALES